LKAYQCKPVEHQVDKVINEEKGHQQLTPKILSTGPNSIEMESSKEGCKERSVQPSSTLRDEFGKIVWHISFSLGSLDILE
jgi:hypothetical protein